MGRRPAWLSSSWSACSPCCSGGCSSSACGLLPKPTKLFGELASLAQPAVFAQRLIALRRLDWVVYAKPPYGGPAQVLAYLGRYTTTATSASVGRTIARAAMPWS
jgi:hypothetical protein